MEKSSNTHKTHKSEDIYGRMDGWIEKLDEQVIQRSGGGWRENVYEPRKFMLFSIKERASMWFQKLVHLLVSS